jgi:hypothetical protein
MTAFSRRIACLSTLIACVACGEKEHAPILKTVGTGNMAGEGGSASGSGSETGGNGSSSETGGNGSSSETGGNGSGGSGNAPSTGGGGRHPMYLMGDHESGVGYALCDLYSGDLVLSIPVGTGEGFTDPTNGHLLYFDHQAGEVRDAQTEEAPGVSCDTFTVTPTGELLCTNIAGCPVFRVDKLGNTYCRFDAMVVDANGVQHLLSDAPPPLYGIHAKPGGGFWLLGATETGIGRWSVDPDGTLEFDGEYEPYEGADPNFGFNLDSTGAAYGTANIGNIGGVVRYSADFKSSTLLLTDESSSCHVYNFNGAIFSTP